MEETVKEAQRLADGRMRLAEAAEFWRPGRARPGGTGTARLRYGWSEELPDGVGFWPRFT